MQETIESKVFSRRASVHVPFWVTGDQIAGSVPNRNTRPFIFLVGSRILCGSDLFVLIVLYVILLYLRNLFHRIGPACTCVLLVARFLSIFDTPVMRYAFWHITSILSLLVHASL